ncbi:Bromodomain-containing protein 8 [Dissophora ornata]|nr:Bromodomain-containing protein 8 [Dissophora ornata]
MSDPASTEIKSDSEPWSVLENLILAQAIYKCGDTNWVAIARTIKGHPQVHRSSNFFSQKSCAIQYTQLLENLEAETRSKLSRSNEAGTSATQVKLAGQLYNQRILEIKALIRKDEERFRALVAELDEIRQGKWDSQLAQELKKNLPEPEPEAAAHENSDSLMDASQPQPDGESALADTTAPSSLSTPSSTSLSEKQDEASQSSTCVPETEISMPTTTNLEANTRSPGFHAGKELKDIEMEDLATLTSTSETLAGSNHVSVAPAEEEDVEMEDVSSKASPSSTIAVASGGNAEQSEVTKVDKKLAGEPKSGASSPKSASDLSPPEGMEEEEGATPEDISQASGAKTEDGANEAVEEEEEEEEEDKKTIKIEAEDKVESKSDTEHASQRTTSRTRGTRIEASPGIEDSSKEDGESMAKSENDMEHDGDTMQEGVEEGATSADDEEAPSTPRSGRKPKKIKTTVPIKRKRRSGRGGASGDTEESYYSTDSEATDSANTNMSDQLMRTQMDDKKWKKILMMIWPQIANHKFGAVFMQPIKDQDAPGYNYMIKRPMDLKSIKERIRDGQITNADEFHRDVLLMFLNALMYNSEDTEVYQMALTMMSDVEVIIENFKSSQSFAPTSGSAGLGGSGSTSNSTTPTTRTAGPELGQPLTRKRKSSGLEMTPVE